MKQNKVEKLLAGVLSISLAMGVSVMPAFAAQVQGLRMRICPGCISPKTTSWPTRVRSPGRDLYVYDRPGYRDRRIGGH